MALLNSAGFLRSRLLWYPLIGLIVLLGAALYLLLYTSYPLKKIKESVTSPNLQVDSLKGNLIDGVIAEKLIIDSAPYRIEAPKVFLKLDLFGCLKNKLLIADEIIIEGLIIDKTVGFLFSEADEDPNLSKDLILGGLLNFKSKSMQLKELFLLSKGNKLAQFDLVEVDNFVLNSKSISFSKLDYRSNKASFNIAQTDLDFAEKDFRIGLIKGRLNRDLSKILKRDIKFEFNTEFLEKEGFAFEGKVADKNLKVVYNFIQVRIDIPSFNLTEYFTTNGPFENFSGVVRFNREGTFNIEAALKLCGKEFIYRGKMFDFIEGDREFTLIPSLQFMGNIVNDRNIFASQKEFSDYVKLELQAVRKSGKYGTPKDLVSDLCWSKKKEELSASEEPIVNEIVKIVKGLSFSLDGEGGVVTDSRPHEVANIDKFNSLFESSKKLFKEGKSIEALKVVESLEPHDSLTSEQRLSFLRYVAWLHLFYGDASKAGNYFEELFDEFKNISDAEGAMRAFDKKKDSKGKAKWVQVIKSLLTQNPELKAKLTVATQNELSGKK